MALRIIFAFLIFIQFDVNAEEQKCLHEWPVFSANIAGREVLLLPSTHAGAFELCPPLIEKIQAFISRGDIEVSLETNTHTSTFPLEKINHGGDDWSPELSDTAKKSIEQYFRNVHAPSYIVDRFKKGKPQLIAAGALIFLDDKRAPTGTDIDDLVFDVAHRMKKTMRFVETTDEQFGAIMSISPSIASKGIERLADYSLCDACRQMYLDWMHDTFSQLSTGKAGPDLDPWAALEKTGYPTAEFDKIADESRNYSLALKISKLSAQGANFFTIGAFHFLGANSVLSNLQSFDSVDAVSCKLFDETHGLPSDRCFTGTFNAVKR